jgi:dienelactone hydrolase
MVTALFGLFGCSSGQAAGATIDGGNPSDGPVTVSDPDATTSDATTPDVTVGTDGAPDAPVDAMGPVIGDAGCAVGACANGATCVDASPGYSCKCLPGYSGATCELPASKAASGIVCPTSGRPADGWPLVFTFNGNCFRAVDGSGLAAQAANELVTTGQACAVAVPYGDLHSGTDVDAVIRTSVVPLIEKNRGLVNTQKIGALGFSAGGAVAAYMGTVWSTGIDPSGGTDHAFRVGAMVNLYGPLRLDRTHATGDGGSLTGGGGLLYLHETRAAGVDVDIPNARQWNATNCFCAARGTSPCTCKTASATYLAAYQPDAGVCSFGLDDASLVSLSATAFIDSHDPAHVAAQYLCAGWKDSNVDYDQNENQAVSYWRPENLVTVRADDGHGFPLSVCEATADDAGAARPLAWMIGKLAAFGSYPPIAH